MYPIADQDIKIYMERLVNKFNNEQINDFFARKYSYTDKIKKKIRSLADGYAEKRFSDLLKIGKVKAKPNWKLPKVIVPEIEGSSIANSLYEKEGSMNGFEERMIIKF